MKYMCHNAISFLCDISSLSYWIDKQRDSPACSAGGYCVLQMITLPDIGLKDVRAKFFQH